MIRTATSLFNSAEPKIHDVDRDGCADLVMWNSQQEASTKAPLVYRNKGGGQFEAMPPEPFTGPAGGYFGLYAVPADVNGDAVVDFVAPRYDGPDDISRTEDDFTTFPDAVEHHSRRPRALPLSAGQPTASADDQTTEPGDGSPEDRCRRSPPSARAGRHRLRSGHSSMAPPPCKIAESILPYFALRYLPEHPSGADRLAIQATMPNRLDYFDDQGFDMSPYRRAMAAPIRELAPFQPLQPQRWRPFEGPPLRGRNR